AARHRIVVQDLVEHVATAQRLARQAFHLPAQAPQVEREAIAQMRLAIAVDLRMRAEHVTQERGIAPHVAQHEERRRHRSHRAASYVPRGARVAPILLRTVRRFAAMTLLGRSGARGALQWRGSYSNPNEESAAMKAVMRALSILILGAQTAAMA